MTPEAELPPEAFAAALAGLPAMGPGRLTALLGRWEPEEAWGRLVRGRALVEAGVAAACRPDAAAVVSLWRRAAASVSVPSVWRAHLDAGIGVHLRNGGRSDEYPAALSGDHQAPQVVFSRGDPGVIEGRRVAIVGTRQCTRYGQELAYELGRELASRGVRVVSGLALGIDGAAHSGALAAGGSGPSGSDTCAAGPPVAVVGTGLDVVYPRRHRALWSSVAGAGVILSEAPLGSPPEGWRFPARNRIIAALAEVVVVVESHMKGGSRHTVEAAEARSVPVMAVPGSVRSSASTFPNALIADGCHPVRDVLDILVALDLATPGGFHPPDRRPAPGAEDSGVLDAVGWEAATLEEIVLRSGRSPGQASLALARLERDGWVAGGAGWWERVSAP